MNETPQTADGDEPERIALADLARRGVVTSAAVTRAVVRTAERTGPGRVAVAAFNSSV